MNAQDCLQLLRDVRDVAFATVDAEGFPQARIIDVMLVENEKLYFCTARGKDFYQQLMHDSHVAIVGMNKQWQTVRLTGMAHELASKDQRVWIDRIFDENPSMKAVYPGDARYILEAFVIDEGHIEFFDLGKEPIYREDVQFGAQDIRKRGFRIGEGCIGCGTCAANCPQQCIEKGSPYRIKPEHCLHCGLCYENCPVQAIARLQEPWAE